MSNFRKWRRWRSFEKVTPSKIKILMKTTKRHQFEMENESWKRSLEFMKQESALLKYRLSEIVDENEAGDLLTIAEYFQNEFITRDEKINSLMVVIGRFSDKLFEIQNKESLSAKMIHQHENLRNEIIEFEKSFLLLSLEFNKKMLESVWP